MDVFVSLCSAVSSVVMNWCSLPTSVLVLGGSRNTCSTAQSGMQRATDSHWRVSRVFMYVQYICAFTVAHWRTWFRYSPVLPLDFTSRNLNDNAKCFNNRVVVFFSGCTNRRWLALYSASHWQRQPSECWNVWQYHHSSIGWWSTFNMSPPT